MRRWIVVLALAVIPAAGVSAVSFIEDDYAAAMVQARARNVPIFVDAWAPW